MLPAFQLCQADTHVPFLQPLLRDAYTQRGSSSRRMSQMRTLWRPEMSLQGAWS